MKNIKIITVQRRSVLDKLLADGVYFSTAENYVKIHKSNLFEPYQYLVKEYGYNHFPIFACVEGHRCEYYGIPYSRHYDSKDSDIVLIELSVPEDKINIQYYYDWVDVIFFMELPHEWGIDHNFSFKDFCHKTLFDTTLQNAEDHRALQVTLEEIRKEWLVDSMPITNKFDALHNGSGGSNVLQELNYYKE